MMMCYLVTIDLNIWKVADNSGGRPKMRFVDMERREASAHGASALYFYRKWSAICASDASA